MTTGAGGPRSTMLRRIGPWVVFAAMMTGCASPAARTAVAVLQGGCDDRSAAPSDVLCGSMALMLESSSVPSGHASDTRTTRQADQKPGPKEDRTTRARASRSSQRTATGRARRSVVTPPPKERRLPKVTIPRITSGFFGPGVSLRRFRIAGDTRREILGSIRRRGPSGGAEGKTQPILRYHIALQRRGDSCKVARTANPAVTMSFAVTLPTWSATRGVDRATVVWWAAELRDTAAHERHHVQLYRKWVRKANQVVATSTCRNVERRLNTVWRQAQFENCMFDVAEYGKAYGITRSDCLRGG